MIIIVEPRVLDDYKSGYWIGVHYQEPDSDFYCFPTIIDKINNRNPALLEDVVEVAMSPGSCPRFLRREFISRIWHVGEKHP